MKRLLAASVALITSLALVGAAPAAPSPVVTVEPEFVFVEEGRLPSLLGAVGPARQVAGDEIRRLVDHLETAAKPSPVEPPPVPPAPLLVRSGSYRAVVTGTSARVTATLELVMTGDGPLEYRLPFDGSAVTETRLDGQTVAPALPPRTGLTDEDLRPALVLRGRGLHRLEVVFHTAVNRFDQMASLSLRTPRAPLGSLELTVDEADVEVEVVPSVGTASTQEGGRTVARAGLPCHAGVFARWHHRAGAAAETGPDLTEEPVELPLVVDASVLSLVTVQASWLDVEHRFRYALKQGRMGAIDIELGETAEVVDVQGPSLARWRCSAPEGGRRHLTIDLETRFDRSFELVVRAIEPLPAPTTASDGTSVAAFRLLGPATRGAATEKGWLVVKLEDDRELVPGTPTALTRVDPTEVPEGRGRDAHLAYKHIEPSWSCPLELQRRPRLEITTVRIDSSTAYVRLTADGAMLVRQTWSVVNTGAQFLTASMPKGSALMSCFVAGRPRAAGGGGEDRILIPLEKSATAPGRDVALPFEVELAYAAWMPEPAWAGCLPISLATLDHPVGRAECRVVAPLHYSLAPAGGTMRWLGTSALVTWLSDAAEACVTLGCGCLTLGGSMSMDRAAPGQMFQAKVSNEMVSTEAMADYADLDESDDLSVMKEEAMAEREMAGKDKAPEKKSKMRPARPMVQRQLAAPSASSGMAYGDGPMGALAPSPAPPPPPRKAQDVARDQLVETLRRSSARKGNLPVRVNVDEGPQGRSLSFAQELVPAAPGGQTLRLRLLRRNLVVLVEWLTLLAATFLGLIILDGGEDRSRRRWSLAVLLLVTAMASWVLHVVPDAATLDYLMAALPLILLFHALRWVEKGATRILTAGRGGR